MQQTNNHTVMGLDSFLSERAVSEGQQPATPAAPAAPEMEPQGQPTQPPVTPPAPPEPSVPPVQGTPPAAQPSFNINDFNAFFGTPYKEESELKDVLKRATEYGDIQKKYTDAETARKALEDKNKELEASLDPMQYFSSPDAYIAEQIKKQMGDVDPSVVTKLLSHEKTKMANFDLLVYDWLMQNPGTIGGVEGAKKVLAKKYDVDLGDPAEEWDPVAQNMMMADARAVERRIAQLKSEVKLPEPLSQEAIAARRAEAIEKAKTAWAPYVGEIANFDKLVVPGDNGTTLLEMEVPKSFRDTLPEYIQGVIEQTGLEPTPENLKEIVDYRNRTFVYDHLPKILEVHGNNIRSEVEAKYAALLNNTTPPNSAIAPTSGAPQPGTGARQLLSGTKRSRLV